METAIAVAILGIVASSAIASLLVLNRYSQSARVMANAREIVQRNIEAAIAAPSSATNVPSILAIATGTIWDDDGGGDNLETLYVTSKKWPSWSIAKRSWSSL